MLTELWVLLSILAILAIFPERGQKVPPQFGHDKIRTEVKIKVGAESAPKITKWGQKAPPK